MKPKSFTLQQQQPGSQLVQLLATPTPLQGEMYTAVLSSFNFCNPLHMCTYMYSAMQNVMYSTVPPFSYVLVLDSMGNG